MIVYVETNFLMSIATGRDAQAVTLLKNTALSADIVIPSICCMEALSALEDELKRRNRFASELDLQISQLKRDQTSPYAKSLLSHLEQSLIENKALLNNIQDRLFDAFDYLNIRVEMIALTADMLQATMKIPLIEKDLTDNLILHCILGNARLQPNEVKVFLSSNTKDFGTQEVQEALQNADVNHYFSHTQDLLGWLRSEFSF